MSVHIGRATNILFQTLPFVLLRALVYSVFAFITLLYFGLLFLIGKAAAALHPMAQVIVWIAGISLSFWLVRLAREYLLYIVKAGHIAVIAELADKGRLPQGESQISWGRKQVQENFKEASVLFVFDQLVTGVIAGINRMMWGVAGIFSAIPAMQGLVKFLNTVLRFSLTYIDEAILARNFIHRDESIWQSAKVGVILYAQAWKQMLTADFALGFIVMILLPIVFFLLLGAIAGTGLTVHGLGIFAIVAVAVLSFLAKAILFDPWALIIMILNYLEATKGIVVDPEWEGRIEGCSSKFQEIVKKAAETSAPVVAGLPPRRAT